MKGVWIDAGNDPQWEKLAANKITWLYFPLSDPVADVQRRLADTKARGLRGGVYAVWNWGGFGDTGAEFAEAVDAKLKAITPKSTAGWPKVMLDNELHDPAHITDMLRRWRELRRYTDTAWTLESMQGGWMSPDFVAEVVSRRVRIVPQSYVGNMTGVDPLAAARDLTDRGFPDSLISPFYDAALLGNLVGWEGFAFTQGRLP